MIRRDSLRSGAWLFVLPLLLSGVAEASPSHAGGAGLWDVRSAKLPVQGSYSIQLSGVGYRISASETARRPADRDLLDGGLQVGYAWRDDIELWAHLNAAAFSFDGATVFSPRDARLGAKYRLPALGWASWALAGHLNVPTGTRDRGFSTGGADPNLTALLTLPLPDSNTIRSAMVHFNVGYQWHLDDRGRTFEGWPPYYLAPAHPADDRNRLDLRTALELRGERITVYLELLLDSLASPDVSFQEGPVFLTPGLRYSFNSAWSFSLGSKISLASDDNGTDAFLGPEDIYPDWQLAFGLTWEQAGPLVDRDEDGVPDSEDACPDQPEDRDGFQDDDGCPDLDNDGDGVPDRFDAAPDLAEDLDGHADTDGIPDLDNDGDGIPDEFDACPDTPEDLDGVADGDGCPERDADRDRILDEDDECPEEPETYDGIDDDDGCPDEVGLGTPYQLKGVLWEGRSVAPTPSSYRDLNLVAEDLLAKPDIRVEVRVHSPVQPGERQEQAEDLALLRAEYLKAFLVTAGVEPHRVLARGDTEESIFDSPFEGPQRLKQVRVDIVPRIGAGVANQ